MKPSSDNARSNELTVTVRPACTSAGAGQGFCSMPGTLTAGLDELQFIQDLNLFGNGICWLTANEPCFAQAWAHATWSYLMGPSELRSRKAPSSFLLLTAATSMRRLSAALAVKETGSTTKAGKLLGLTQSAVSRLIISLEDTIGFALFDRVSGKMVVNPRTALFFSEAERICASVVRLKEVSENIRSSRTTCIRVATLPTLGLINLLPKAIGRFMRDAPDVWVEVELRQRRDISKSIAEQDFDLGIVSRHSARMACGSSRRRVPPPCAFCLAVMRLHERR